MLDLKFIRQNTDLVRQAIVNRQDSTPLEEILQLDSERRQKILELEDLRHTRKEAAREKKQVSPDEGRSLRAKIRTLEEEVRNLKVQIQDIERRRKNEVETKALDFIRERNRMRDEISKYYNTN